mmetsp:Transcript_4216/g.13460  ORF Transcript_4216/g.13460 Transcript_4216/m.13460 type:complete len:325 (+) Transcript_4216:181-1155(+)
MRAICDARHRSTAHALRLRWTAAKPLIFSSRMRARKLRTSAWARSYASALWRISAASNTSWAWIFAFKMRSAEGTGSGVVERRGFSFVGCVASVRTLAARLPGSRYAEPGVPTWALDSAMRVCCSRRSAMTASAAVLRRSSAATLVSRSFAARCVAAARRRDPALCSALKCAAIAASRFSIACIDNCFMASIAESRSAALGAAAAHRTGATSPPRGPQRTVHGLTLRAAGTVASDEADTVDSRRWRDFPPLAAGVTERFVVRLRDIAVGDCAADDLDDAVPFSSALNTNASARRRPTARRRWANSVSASERLESRCSRRISSNA